MENGSDGIFQYFQVIYQNKLLIRLGVVAHRAHIICVHKNEEGNNGESKKSKNRRTPKYPKYSLGSMMGQFWNNS